jgi:hypothetical protein
MPDGRRKEREEYARERCRSTRAGLPAAAVTALSARLRICLGRSGIGNATSQGMHSGQRPPQAIGTAAGNAVLRRVAAACVS